MSEKRHTKLTDHVFKKGKFITPINNIPSLHECKDESHGLMGACLSIYGLV